MPDTFPVERLVVGELHLVRQRLDRVLIDVADLVDGSPLEADAGWARVEEAARLARRAMNAAVGAAPPLGSTALGPECLSVGSLQVDVSCCRQWYGDAEVALSPLRHRLLAVMAAEPFRVFAKDELLRRVWRRRSDAASNCVNTSISRVRRALIAAGAPADEFMLSLHGTGWALTRPKSGS